MKIIRTKEDEIELTDKNGNTVHVSKEDVCKMAEIFERCFDCRTCNYLSVCDAEGIADSYIFINGVEVKNG